MQIAALSLLVSVLATARPSQAQEPPGPDREVAAAFQQWRARHGGGWILRARPGLGTARFLYGGTAEPAFHPRGDEEWVELALEAVARVEPLFRIPAGTLVPREVARLPFGGIGREDKVAVLFDQAVAGVPVVRGTVNLLFTPDGGLLAVDASALPGAQWLDASPVLGRFAAVAAAVGEFERSEGCSATRILEPELVIHPRDHGAGPSPRLAWAVELHGPGSGLPAGRRMFVSADAEEPEILDAEQLVHACQGPGDVFGTVESWATPGTAPDTGANPETLQPMRFLEVTSAAGSAVTDETGAFVIPGVATSSLTVTGGYSGPYCRVENAAGGNHSASSSFTRGTAGTLVLNDPRTELTTAQANAFEGVIDFRQFLKAIDPNENTMDFQVLANVNISNSCNAYFNGSSINFYTSGGGCVNTAYSTVVAHEEGHWANVREGSGNGPDGFGEGNADTYAMYVHDTPIVGEDFCGSGCFVRTGNNTRQFCGDTNPGCHGGVHANGEVLMGALWKVRRNLNATHGNALGDLVADTLFVNWMNAYDDGQIRTFIEDHWLALDDDDGDITNGTPNFADIDGAFREQGFPGVSVSPVTIVHAPLPDTMDETGPYPVVADITSSAGAIVSAEVKYSVDGGPVQTVAMANTGGDTWEGGIPGQPAPATVRYHIEAVDSATRSGRDPESGEHSFDVLPSPGRAIVDCITYRAKTNRKGRSTLTVLVSVVDDGGLPVSSARVSITARLNGSVLGSGTKRTNTGGDASFRLRNAAPGCYEVDVTAILAAGLAFDGSEPANGHLLGQDKSPDSDCRGSSTLCGQN